MFSENIRLSSASLKKGTIVKHRVSSAHVTAEALENGPTVKLQIYLPGLRTAVHYVTCCEH